MTFKLRTFVFLVATGCVLASCSSMRNIGSHSVAAVKHSTNTAISKLSDLPLVNRLPGQGPTVVKVRKEDLQDMPTGRELAKGYEKRRSGFWIFGGPVDFKEPTLPESGTGMDGSLLPPRMP